MVLRSDSSLAHLAQSYRSGIFEADDRRPITFSFLPAKTYPALGFRGKVF